MQLNLRPSLLNEIYRILDNKRQNLSIYDFSITQNNGSLHIQYKYQPSYFLEFTFNNKKEEYFENGIEEESKSLLATSKKRTKSKDYIVRGRMAPGTIATIEEFEIIGNFTYDFKRQVGIWVESLWDDLSVNPMLRQVVKQDEKLNEFINQFNFDNINGGEEHFNNAEVENLKIQLKKIEQQLAAELKKVIDDAKILKTELSDLKKEFNSMRASIPSLTKKNWYKSTLSKIFIWGSTKENQKLIKAATSFGKNLIELIK